MGYKAVWTFTFSDQAERDLLSLDPQHQRNIKKKIIEMLDSRENATTFLKQLTGSMSHLYSLRVGDYRLICDVQRSELIIMAVKIAHRKHVYGGH